MESVKTAVRDPKPRMPPLCNIIQRLWYGGLGLADSHAAGSVVLGHVHKDFPTLAHHHPTTSRRHSHRFAFVTTGLHFTNRVSGRLYRGNLAGWTGRVPLVNMSPTLVCIGGLGRELRPLEVAARILSPMVPGR